MPDPEVNLQLAKELGWIGIVLLSKKLLFPSIFFILMLLFLFQSTQVIAADRRPESCLKADTSISFNNTDKLIILTHNIDSIQYFTKDKMYPNPFCPTMETYSAIILLKDSSFAKVIIKDAGGNVKASFNWDSVKPGAYKFRWWENINPLPSGVYYVVVITNKNTTTDKAILIK